MNQYLLMDRTYGLTLKERWRKLKEILKDGKFLSDYSEFSENFKKFEVYHVKKLPPIKQYKAQN